MTLLIHPVLNNAVNQRLVFSSDSCSLDSGYTVPSMQSATIRITVFLVIFYNEALFYDADCHFVSTC